MLFVFFWECLFLKILYYIAKIQPCCCICLTFITRHKSNCKRGGMKEFAECAGHSQRSIAGKRTCGYGNYFKTILSVPP